jgi:phosphatidylinositol 3-kinase
MAVKSDVKVYSSKDVSLEFSLNVKALYGQLPRSRAGYVENEVLVATRLLANDEPLTSEVTSTMVVHADGLAEWKEKLSFPIKVRDLPRGTTLELKVLSARKFPHSILGHASLDLFSGDDALVQGLQMVTLSTFDTPSFEFECPGPKFTEQQAELQHLEQLLVEYEQGHLPPVNWLDNLVFARIRDIRKTQLSITQSTDNFVQLLIELPVFSLPVLFFTERANETQQKEQQRWQRLTWLVDDEVNFIMDNPAERKHQKLQRSVGRGVIDMELKPDGAEKRRLSAIIQLPPTRALDMEAQNLLWKFRFAIRYDSKALTKFLKCVDWTDPAETKASVQLMHEWAPIGPATALELLTPSFTNSDVRRYAVTILAQVDDEELLLYLLQLVQVRMRLRMHDHARLKFPREHHLFNYLSTDHYLITGATL